eukprot:c23403_g1_i1 orf=507-1373(+)
MDGSTNTDMKLLACPICFEPFNCEGSEGLDLKEKSRPTFLCQRCKKSYHKRGVFLDLIAMGDTYGYDEYSFLGTGFFRNRVISYVYERGWRSTFKRDGFPGPDEEFTMAKELLRPAAGGVLLDVSCGTGVMSRRFARCGIYSTVFALDFSETMLQQCSEFLKEDDPNNSLNITLVRGDVARLPFPTGTIDAVHAAAALHCWPSPAAAMIEISRVLKPGGVFMATTFLDITGDIPLDMLKPVRQAWRKITRLTFWLESELQNLCESCGLVDYQRIRKNRFIMVSARKST